MTTSDLSGTTLDQFHLVRPLGEGGMGVVYVGEDQALRRRVAVKVLAPKLLEDQRARQRFQQEITHAAAIEHPHVVPVYAAGYDQGLFYLVLRLVDGPDVATELQRISRFEESRALRIIGQVASALWAVHNRDLVHRDVKPHNVLLGYSGQADEHAVLTDFGIAKALDASSSLTGVGPIGTPPYMAPELWKGGPATAATDQYALGCMAYEMLAGEAPFDASELSPQDAHLSLDPRPLSEHGAVSPEIAAAVHRALAKNPEDRFSDIRSLAITDPRIRRSFDAANTASEILTSEGDRAAEALATQTDLSDGAIALVTEQSTQAVSRLRRRAARTALIGAHRSVPRRHDATGPDHGR